MKANLTSLDRIKGQVENIKTSNIFGYAATCEKNFEYNLQAMKGGERKTTFFADLSIAEVFGKDDVIDTCKRVLNEWLGNEVYTAEFVLSVNWKSWEHQARGNDGWCKFYGDLYFAINDIVYDAYAEDEEKMDYYYHYMD